MIARIEGVQRSGELANTKRRMVVLIETILPGKMGGAKISIQPLFLFSSVTVSGSGVRSSAS